MATSPPVYQQLTLSTPMVPSIVPSNSALLTDALGLQLRCAHRAAKRGR